MSINNKSIHRESSKSRSEIARSAANRRWELRREIARDVAVLVENYSDEILDQYEEMGEKDRGRMEEHLNNLIDELKVRGRDE